MNSLNQVNLLFLLFSLFTIKHFIVDYLLQNKYQWSNKGKYFHPGGILHGALHGFSTFIIFSFFHFESSNPIIFPFILGTIDFFIHYHIDWIKTNVNKKLKYKQEHKGFWILIGIDQTLHFLTYILLIYLSINVFNNSLLFTLLIAQFAISIIFLWCCGISCLIYFYTNSKIKQLNYDS